MSGGNSGVILAISEEFQIEIVESKESKRNIWKLGASHAQPPGQLSPEPLQNGRRRCGDITPRVDPIHINKDRGPLPPRILKSDKPLTLNPKPYAPNPRPSN